MMAFVEDVAGRDRRVVEAAESRLRHHQRMIGNNDPRLACLADVLFDETATKMRTGRMHAFAAAIGKPTHPAASNELAEPSRKIAGHQITAFSCSNPARDQAEMAWRSSLPPGYANRLL